MDEAIIFSMKKHIGRLRRDPEQKVHAPLAEAYRRSGLTSDAKETAHTGLDKFPGYLLCREVLGKIYFKQGKLEKARAELEVVSKVVKNNSELSRLLGKLYLQLGLEEEAESELRFVLKKDPFDFEVRNLLVGLEKKRSFENQPVDDNIDLFTQEVSEKTYDIENIINSLEDPEVKERAQYAKATDVALDALEDMEGVIDEKADEIFEKGLEDDGKKIKRSYRKEHPEVFKDKHKEIQAAARIGTIHMELHILDEASILAKRLLDKDPTDNDLVLLNDKFKQALEKKEKELEQMESMEIGLGL